MITWKDEVRFILRQASIFALVMIALKIIGVW